MPDGYEVCYTANADNFLKGELKTECVSQDVVPPEETHSEIDGTTPDNENEENNAYEIGEGEVENPETGSTINWGLLVIFLGVSLIVLIFIQRKKLVFKIR